MSNLGLQVDVGGGSSDDSDAEISNAPGRTRTSQTPSFASSVGDAHDAAAQDFKRSGSDAAIPMGAPRVSLQVGRNAKNALGGKGGGRATARGALAPATNSNRASNASASAGKPIPGGGRNRKNVFAGARAAVGSGDSADSFVPVTPVSVTGDTFDWDEEFNRYQSQTKRFDRPQGGNELDIHSSDDEEFDVAAFDDPFAADRAAEAAARKASPSIGAAPGRTQVDHQRAAAEAKTIPVAAAATEQTVFIDSADSKHVLTPEASQVDSIYEASLSLFPVVGWTPKTEYRTCHYCENAFAAGHQHHCRLCGHMYCSMCTAKFNVHERFKKKGKRGPVRVCYGCEYRCISYLRFRAESAGDDLPAMKARVARTVTSTTPLSAMIDSVVQRRSHTTSVAYTHPNLEDMRILAREELTLLSLLQHPLGYSYFKLHVDAEHSQENLDLYSAIGDFLLLCGKTSSASFVAHSSIWAAEFSGDTLGFAKAIFKEFVRAGAPSEVHLSPADRKKIVDGVAGKKTVDPSLFDRLCTFIVNTVLETSFVAFRDTPLFTEFLGVAACESGVTNQVQAEALADQSSLLRKGNARESVSVTASPNPGGARARAASPTPGRRGRSRTRNSMTHMQLVQVLVHLEASKPLQKATSPFSTEAYFVPEWVSKSSFKECSKCYLKKKGKWGRRHNCCMCGQVFCSTCTTHISVPVVFRQDNKPSGRVCGRCRYHVLGGAQIVPKHREEASRATGGKSMARRISTNKVLLTGEQQATLKKVAAPQFLVALQSLRCPLCDVEFNLFTRRHRCAHCNLRYCKKCLLAHRVAVRNEAQGGAPVIVETVVEADGDSSTGGAPLLKSAETEADAKQISSKKAAQLLSPTSVAAHATSESAMRAAAQIAGVAAAEDVQEAREDFEILGILGQGTFGSVFKARDKRDDKLVAIKVLDEYDETSMEDLRREIEFMKGCDSERVAKYVIA